MDRMKKLVANGPVKHPGARCAQKQGATSTKKGVVDISILANVAWNFVVHSVHLDFPSINKRNR